MNKYPLSLSAFYLDFSYTGAMNLQTRFFMRIPFVGEYTKANEKIDFLEICFDMNSIFNKEGYQSKDNIELGLNVLLDIQSLHLPNKNCKKYIQNEFHDDAENFTKNYFFDSEKKLYNSFKGKIREFLELSYSEENWLKFVQERIIKNTQIVSFNEDQKKIFLDSESIKIKKFIEETLNRIDIIFSPNVIDDEFFNKYRISLKPNERSIVNQILNSVPLDEMTHVQELNNISKTYQYYNLSNELPINQSNSKNKNKL